MNLVRSSIVPQTIASDTAQKTNSKKNFAAAGAVEAVVSSMVVGTGVIPPTINYCHPDPELDLNYTPNVSVERDVNAVLSNSFGFGGHNTTLAIKRFKN